MKTKKTVLVLLVIVFSVAGTFAQKISKKNVPSIIINSFHQHFPRAYDVEWELKNEMYKVEFETGLARYDHSVWYDKKGSMVKHREEISKRKLPEGVLLKLNSEYDKYRVSDVKKITENNKIIYSLELKWQYEEWKMKIQPDGTVISKTQD